MKILSPAKINLFLHVRGKRPDGYHELFSLMCCITLFDEISLEFGGAESIEINCSHPNVPADETNLAHQAASLFLSQMGSARSLKIQLIKNIPVAAGLGGGSSNAADVPFFIFQKPAIATGIGEKFDAFKGDLPYHFLLLYPGFNVSTAETYQNMNLGLTKAEKKPTSNHLKPSRFDPARHLTNDLEQVTALRYPEIGLAKENLLNLGAVGALMSGSGPTVFGLFENAETAEAAKQALSCDQEDQDVQLFLAEPILDADLKRIDI